LRAESLGDCTTLDNQVRPEVLELLKAEADKGIRGAELVQLCEENLDEGVVVFVVDAQVSV